MNYKKNNILGWIKDKDFSKTSPKTFKKFVTIIGVLLLTVFLLLFFEIYVPANPISHETITYTVVKGWGDDEIAKDLKKIGVIRSEFFFKFYVAVSFQHANLQAGKYSISPRMSIYQIAKKMAWGNVIKEKILIYEGWDIKDIGEYLESKDICKEAEFIEAANKDYSAEFDFLNPSAGGKPKDIGLEGYLFPDTYQISEGASCDDIVLAMLSNFDKKLTPDLKAQISEQKKSVFEIITMASMIEKEVRTISDKKIVSGILWKRLSVGMPLQLDATVNYATGKSDASCSIKDTKIDSPYNTYKYKGLPKGPISNPGMDSIVAALNPTKTAYWFYLSDGITHFSKTLEEHTEAKAKYLD
jgi:UPF0755 protein